MGQLAALLWLRLGLFSDPTIGEVMSFHCTVARAGSDLVTLPSLPVLLSRTTSRRVLGFESKLIRLFQAKPSRSRMT